jgi:hypothetical protein
MAQNNFLDRLGLDIFEGVNSFDLIENLTISECETMMESIYNLSNTTDPVLG